MLFYNSSAIPVDGLNYKKFKIAFFAASGYAISEAEIAVEAPAKSQNTQPFLVDPPPKKNP